MKRKTIYTLTESAIMIAFATVLSFLEIQIGAFGGSVNFAMFPIVIIGFRSGALWGLGSGMTFGLIKCIIGGGLSWGIPSVILDYILAYGAVGLAGIFKGKFAFLEVSAIFGGVLRYLITCISGVILWGIVEPTTIDGIGVFTNPWLYSVVYNAIYIVPSILGVVALLAILRKPLKIIDKKFR